MTREPLNARELRRALLERVDKHDGHWYWTGTLDNGVPRIHLAATGPRSARRLAWELFIGGEAPPKVQAACGRLCIRPACLTSSRCQRPGHLDLTPARECLSCKREWQRRREQCEICGRSLLARLMAKHRCPGRPAEPAPVAELRATQDAVRDYQRGMTPERICEAYAVQPATLAKRIERQAERSPIEEELARALRALAARHRPTEGPK